MGAIVALSLAVFMVVAAAGGSPTALNQLGILPILLGTYLFGMRGALGAAALVSLMLGPVAVAVGVSGGSKDAWPWIRPVMFLTVGATMGLVVDNLRGAHRRIQQQRRESLVAFARSAEAKDQDTGQHVVRCRGYSEALARAINLSDAEVDDIAWSSVLHDVGKLHVPDRILLKPGRLSGEEWEIMQRHTIWGAEILRHGEGFETARRIARWHHERFDGMGYPDHLEGEAIPLEARIVAVADAYDAMTSDRPYQAALTVEQAIDELRRGAEKQFDPELARIFIALLERDPALRYGKFASDSGLPDD